MHRTFRVKSKISCRGHNALFRCRFINVAVNSHVKVFTQLAGVVVTTIIVFPNIGSTRNHQQFAFRFRFQFVILAVKPKIGHTCDCSDKKTSYDRFSRGELHFDFWTTQFAHINKTQRANQIFLFKFSSVQAWIGHSFRDSTMNT